MSTDIEKEDKLSLDTDNDNNFINKEEIITINPKPFSSEDLIDAVLQQKQKLTRFLSKKRKSEYSENDLEDLGFEIVQLEIEPVNVFSNEIINTLKQIAEHARKEAEVYLLYTNSTSTDFYKRAKEMYTDMMIHPEKIPKSMLSTEHKNSYLTIDDILQGKK